MPVAVTLDPRLDKIRKLMALALNNQSDEEARSAALKAVQLMSELNVEIVLPQPAQSAPFPFEPFPFQPAPNFADYERIMRDQQNQQSQRSPFSAGMGGAGWYPFNK